MQNIVRLMTVMAAGVLAAPAANAVTYEVDFYYAAAWFDNIGGGTTAYYPPPLHISHDWPEMEEIAGLSYTYGTVWLTDIDGDGLATPDTDEVSHEYMRVRAPSDNLAEMAPGITNLFSFQFGAAGPSISVVSNLPSYFVNFRPNGGAFNIDCIEAGDANDHVTWCVPFSVSAGSIGTPIGYAYFLGPLTAGIIGEARVVPDSPTTPVPEPSAPALFAAGLALLGWMRRRVLRS